MRTNPVGLFFAATVTSAVTSHAAIFDRDYASLAVKLDQGMTEAQVTATLGHAPSSVSLTTCGQAAGKPWLCKVETFGRSFSGHSLMVFFAKSAGGDWIVAEWRAE
jgi:hypothetical protein